MTLVGLRTSATRDHRTPQRSQYCHDVEVLWDTQGIMHHEVLDSIEMVNSNLYCQKIERANQELIKNDVYTTKTQFEIARPNVSIMTRAF